MTGLGGVFVTLYIDFIYNFWEAFWQNSPSKMTGFIGYFKILNIGFICNLYKGGVLPEYSCRVTFRDKHCERTQEANEVLRLLFLVGKNPINCIAGDNIVCCLETSTFPKKLPCNRDLRWWRIMRNIVSKLFIFVLSSESRRFL